MEKEKDSDGSPCGCADKEKRETGLAGVLGELIGFAGFALITFGIYLLTVAHRKVTAYGGDDAVR